MAVEEREGSSPRESVVTITASRYPAAEGERPPATMKARPRTRRPARRRHDRREGARADQGIVFFTVIPSERKNPRKPRATSLLDWIGPELLGMTVKKTIPWSARAPTRRSWRLLAGLLVLGLAFIVAG